MDPLKELDQTYKQLGSNDKTSFLVKHLELLLTSAKKEIIDFNKVPSKTQKNEEENKIIYKTSSPELIGIPTLLIPSIQEELENNRTIEQAKVSTDQALKVFDVVKKSKKDSDKKLTQPRRIIKARKSSSIFSNEDERLALNQEKRAKLDLKEEPTINSESVIATVSSFTINTLKNFLMAHYQETKTTENGIKRIKSVRIKDGLEAAEHSIRRQGSIKSMIDALKREDRRNEIKSSGVRLASR